MPFCKVSIQIKNIRIPFQTNKFRTELMSKASAAPPNPLQIHQFPNESFLTPKKSALTQLLFKLFTLKSLGGCESQEYRVLTEFLKKIVFHVSYKLHPAQKVVVQVIA